MDDMVIDSGNELTDEEFLQEEDKLPEKKGYSRMECVFAFLSLLFSFLFVRFVIYYAAGFAATGLYIAIITAVIIYLKKSGCRFTKLNIAIAAVLYLFSLVFSITDNGLIKFLDVVFLFAGGAYFVYSAAAENRSVERFLPFAMIKSLFEFPCSKFCSELEAVGSTVSGSGFGRNLRMILTGLAVTVPLTGVVGSLLMSADDGIKRMIENAGEFISSENLMQIFIQLCLAVPCACYLFGLIYSNSHKDELKPLISGECEEKLNNARVVQNIIIYTAVTPICILYVMFFISQANYLLSAFSGELPEGYLYSDYARKGFFELSAIAFINLIVLIVMNLLAKSGGRSKPAALRVYSVLLCIFTMLMIAAAASKMVMYISVYGLTRLRVYTMWFMLLLALFFVIIAIKQFRFDFSASGWGTAVFTVMFAVLCFSRPDALIANYNIRMYNSGKLEELDKDALMSMSDDAVAAALKSGAITSDEAEENREIRSRRKGSYATYNISALIAENYIGEK